jgi:hypothetical protein
LVPLWFRQERKKEKPDEFFTAQSSARQRAGLAAACRSPRLNVEQWAPNLRNRLVAIFQPPYPKDQVEDDVTQSCQEDALAPSARFHPTAFYAVSFQQPFPIFDNRGNDGVQA